MAKSRFLNASGGTEILSHGTNGIKNIQSLHPKLCDPPIHRWPDCQGRAQSPIDVKLDEVEIKDDAGAFVFEGYDIPIHGQVNDNGHALSKYYHIVSLYKMYSHSFP